VKGKKLLIGLLAAVVLVAVTVAPVMADTGTTDITGTVPKAIEVTAPGDFSMPSLDPATSPITSSVQTATVNANHADWTLTVVEAGGTPDGKMAPTAGDPLASAMTVKGGDQATYASLASAVSLETAGATGTTDINDIYFQQAVGWGDEAGDYSITVTFEASAAS
jgi:hypothetical protein